MSPMLSPQKRAEKRRRVEGAKEVVNAGMKPVLVEAEDGPTVIWVEPEVEAALALLRAHPRVSVKVGFKGSKDAPPAERTIR